MPSKDSDDQLQLKVGLILQLESERFGDSRPNAKLIGYLADESLIVTMPTMAEGLVGGDRVVCRALSGRVAIAFRTRVMQAARTPFPHLFLAYPEGVETATVRKALRLTIRQQAELKRSVPSEVREPALLVDISLLGAGAIAKAEFAAVSDTLVLLLPPLQNAEVPIPVTVRNIRPVEGGTYYGLEFGDLGNEGLRAIDRMMQERFKRGGGF